MKKKLFLLKAYLKQFFKLLIINLIMIFLLSNKKLNRNFINNNTNNTFNSIVYKLNKNKNRRIPKYILLMDYYPNPYCNDLNAYYIFKYYQKKKNNNAYYVINLNSDLYKYLKIQNKTQNLIPINSNDNIYDKLYEYILNSKIIINSYVNREIQRLISNVSFLKYLYLTHAVGYFKKRIIAIELHNVIINKRNIIVSSPYEYKFYKKYLNYSENYMHKAGLPRYDRFKEIKKNHSEKQCILITFTYRRYSNIIYEKSLFKKNLEKLLNDKTLINFLNKKDIDLIYIPHHNDLFKKRPFNPKNFPYIKYAKQALLSHYIEQCSLFITDFSSIAFDFMFLNKPALFYLIDVKDKINFVERQYMQYNYKNNIYFGNVFYSQRLLIERIIYYTNQKFKINNELKKKYDSLFYYKCNITEKIIDIINNIINN